MKQQQVDEFVALADKTINGLRFDDEKFTWEKVFAICDHNKLKGTKPNVVLTKAAQRLFRNKPFIYKVSDNIYYGFLVAKHTDKQFYWVNLMLYRVSTPKGQLYISKAMNGDITIYTAHAFDRYAQRCGLKNRDKAIRNFLKDFALRPTGNFDVSDKRFPNSQILSTTTGMFLGEGLNKVTLMKTFISNKELTDRQADLLDHLDEQFDDETIKIGIDTLINEKKMKGTI